MLKFLLNYFKPNKPIEEVFNKDLLDKCEKVKILYKDVTVSQFMRHNSREVVITTESPNIKDLHRLYYKCYQNVLVGSYHSIAIGASLKVSTLDFFTYEYKYLDTIPSEINTLVGICEKIIHKTKGGQMPSVVRLISSIEDVMDSLLTLSSTMEL